MVSGGDASFDGRLLSRKTSVCTHSTQNAEENFQGASTNSERTKVQDGSYDSKTFKPPPPPCSPPNPTVPSSVRETPKPEMPVLKGHEPRRLMTLSPCLPETDALVHRKSLMSSRISDLDRRKYGQSTIIKDGILEKWTNYLGAWRARYGSYVLCVANIGKSLVFVCVPNTLICTAHLRCPATFIKIFWNKASRDRLI